jgi:hypothetical protein
MQARSYFYYGRKLSYICACSMKVYDVMEIKQCIGKVVYHVTMYTICSVVVTDAASVLSGLRGGAEETITYRA